MCTNITDTCGNEKSTLKTFSIPPGAKRHEFLLRSNEKQTVPIYLYDGDEPTDQFSLTLSSGQSRHTATVTQDCCFSITILQPMDNRPNAQVSFSDSRTNEILRGNDITYLGFQTSKPLLVCSRGSAKECNWFTQHERTDKDITHLPTESSIPDESRKDKERTNPVLGTADTTKDGSNDSVTDGCNKTVTTALGILLAISLMINKILLIRIGLRYLCSNRSDKESKVQPSTNGSRLCLEPRKSAHISENSLYGAVIDRR
ncbi:uncharacterized protein [Palaemon carinicauda]|uniref:uncharacterized protein n=1 Tax=Palaemon carinicauda TaxID=392227 RepID=UPI0035B66947